MMNTMNLVFAIALALLGTANAANFRLAAAKTGVTAADATVVATFEDVSLLEESSKKGVIKDLLETFAEDNDALKAVKETFSCIEETKYHAAKPTNNPQMFIRIGKRFKDFFGKFPKGANIAKLTKSVVNMNVNALDNVMNKITEMEPPNFGAIAEKLLKADGSLNADIAAKVAEKVCNDLFDVLFSIFHFFPHFFHPPLPHCSPLQFKNTGCVHFRRPSNEIAKGPVNSC